MKTTILRAIFISSILFSCQKEKGQKIEQNVVRKNLPSFESILNFENDNQTSGKFLVNVSSSLGEKDNSMFRPNINGAFLNIQTRQKENGNINYFNGIPIHCSKDGNSYYNKDLSWDESKFLFGSNIKLGLNRTIGQSTIGDTAYNYNGGYIPNVFVCTNQIEKTVSGNDVYMSGTVISPGFNFTWDKDSLNLNGVFIYLEYNPTTIGNQGFSRNLVRKANAILVKDNGSYRLTEDLFEDFPLNSVVTVYIGRGNFEYIKQIDGTLTNMQMSSLTYQYDNLYYKIN